MNAGRAIEKLLRTAQEDSDAGELLWRVRADDGRVDAAFGDQAKPFFIASATKLFVSAILAQMRTEGLIDWDAPLQRYLPHVDLQDLSSIPDFTVRQAMAHQAGLPDYFDGRRGDGTTTFELLRESDFGWNVRDVVEWSRQMRPPRPGRSLYSDTGYQLLGAAIECVAGTALDIVIRDRITRPLGLEGTYLFGPEDLRRYPGIAAMRYGSMCLDIPAGMASVRADGGMVSTVDDGVAFIDGFFSGALFPVSVLDEMCSDWHRVFYPLEYGAGVMRFRMPALMTGLKRVPEFVGHSGVSGTVMFRNHEWGLTVVGTVNQVKWRSQPFRLMVRSALAAGAPRV